MSTQAQIKANQQNAQLSQGPTSAPGLERSSKNALKHGLSGQTLVITPEEREAYEAHVIAFMDHHQPADHPHRELVQQKADARWSLHQVFVQQNMTLSLMAAITAQLSAAGDPVATAAAIAPIIRSLSTLSTYESRRRRALKTIEAELQALEDQKAEQLAAIQRAEQTRKDKEAKDEMEFGFVHAKRGPGVSQIDIERALAETRAAMQRLAMEDAEDREDDELL